jgi:serine/threonine protein phosphatase PrpC
MNSLDQTQTHDLTLPTKALQTDSFHVTACGRTDRGRVRPTNEDQFVIAQLSRMLTVQASSLQETTPRISQRRGHIFMVADGVGGSRAGEQASALTAMTIEDYLVNTLKQFVRLEGSAEQRVLKDFQCALQEADARLFEAAEENPKLAGMGTTLTMAFATQWNLYLAHVGDSRCYLFSGGVLEQVTQDHTYVAEMMRAGALTAEEAKKSRYRNVVTNIVGGTTPGVNVEVHKLDLMPDDVILVCSDGLTGMVSDERIAQMLQAEADLEAVCGQLVAEANAKGGTDNITVILARFEQGKEAESHTLEC